MSEHPQFFGSSEAPKPKEFVLSPEQQQVADTMKQSGEKLEKTVVDARERAGEKLQELRGKELVDAGMRQMGHGVLETIKSQLIGMPFFGLLGGVAGGFFGSELSSAASNIDSILGGDVMPSYSTEKGSTVLNIAGAIAGGYAGVGTGAIMGFEMAAIDYNKKVAPKENLPKVKFIEWIASNVGVIAIRSVIRNNTTRFILSEAFNPISVSGLFNTATGLLQMGRE